MRETVISCLLMNEKLQIRSCLHEESQRQNYYDMVIIRSRRLGVRKPYRVLAGTEPSIGMGRGDSMVSKWDV